jgi:negative regulator of sigma E activity
MNQRIDPLATRMISLAMAVTVTFAVLAGITQFAGQDSAGSDLAASALAQARSACAARS